MSWRPFEPGSWWALNEEQKQNTWMWSISLTNCMTDDQLVLFQMIDRSNEAQVRQVEVLGIESPYKKWWIGVRGPAAHQSTLTSFLIRRFEAGRAIKLPLWLLRPKSHGGSFPALPFTLRRGRRNCGQPFFSLSWRAPSRSYGRTATLRLIVQPCDEDDQFCYSFLWFGAPVKWNWQGKTKVLEEKPDPVPLCAPQIPHGLTPGSNPGLRGERPATNSQSHGTATNCGQ
jgi:hypothetical protein